MLSRLQRSLFPLAVACLSSPAAFASSEQPAAAPWKVQVAHKDATPVPGATVELLGLRGEPVHATTETDASGAAVLQPPTAGSFLIRVRKPGYRSQQQAYLASPPGTEPKPIEFKLERGS